MKYNSDTCTVELSVRSLCAMAIKSGDLDGRSHVTYEDLTRGGELHRRTQTAAGLNYIPEVSLLNTTLFDGMYYTVRGRADGVIRAKDGVCVDEIKSVRGYEFFLPPREIYLGQLKCYAYFLAVRDGLARVKGRITYVNSENDKIKYFNYSFSAEELREYYTGLLERISPYARFAALRELDVLPAAAGARFPYAELREGQQMMIRECYGAIKRGQRLFVEAPTGTGKTISSLYPAVRALGEKKTDKIFYLTAKASTRTEAFRAASRIFGSGVGIRAIVLSSKESMCRCSAGAARAKDMCAPEKCPFARGYYDRVDGALLEMLSTGNGYPQKAILSVAQKHGVCPYELSLDLSEFCDVIICDYNYAFDPSVYLRRYFGEDGRREKYVFLVDEAHNLADRARDMYSAVLCRSQFSAIQMLLSELDGEMDNALSSVIGAFGALRRLCKDSIIKDAEGNERGFFMSRSPLSNFNEELERFRKRCETWLRKNREHEQYEAIDGLCSSVRKYLCVTEYFDKGFLCYVELGGGDITAKTFCLDPSSVMRGLLNRAVASVMFSATLTPCEYFCDVLGCAKTGVSVTLPSPFDSDNLCVTVADYLSMRYGDRLANTGKFVSVIAAAVSARAGNYIVYFPSYESMERVYKLFALKYPDVETVVQARSMSYSDREAFISSFKADTGRLRVGFCVLGGAFSEGIDLAGSRLIGTVIFGVGLPGLSNERNIIRDYFEEDTGMGYDYAYTYPGMNNVLQAAGRVIRTDSDRGVVVLVDDRYASPKYRRLFPAHWKNINYAGNARSLAENVRRFWKNKG